jgi:hypothetical protein
VKSEIERARIERDRREAFGHLPSFRKERPAMAKRTFGESEATARARAEQDWTTRDRITYAHEHLGEAHGVDPKRLRLLNRQGMPLTLDAIRKAGLTLGEALAAGIKIAPGLLP